MTLPPPHRPPSLRAATLLELLACLTVIAVLASLAVPTLGRVRHGAARIGCHNNLRQWGLATTLYAMDSNDTLPPDGAPNGISRRSAWYTDLPPVVHQRPYPEAGPWRTNAETPLPANWWICPANSRRSNGKNLFHYCLNKSVNGTGLDSRPARISDLANPPAIVWLYDNGGLAAVAGINNAHPAIHGAGSLFLFVDGHASWHASREYWDVQRQRGRPASSSMVWEP